MVCFPSFQKYRKIPKISPGAYIFQRPLFEGFVFGGAYIRRGLSTEGNLRFNIDWASLIVGSKFTVFALFGVFFWWYFWFKKFFGFVFFLFLFLLFFFFPPPPPPPARVGLIFGEAV